MKIKKFRYFVGDFETTVYDGQEDTEVWASACCELYKEDAKVFHSIAEQFEFFKSLKSNVICYYHNLKFDGSFWLSYFLKDLNYRQAYRAIDKEGKKVEWVPEKEMKNNTFKYSISVHGQWYTIIVKVGGYFIEFRDSLKLLPFTAERLGDSFKTKHRKLTMEYKGFRFAGCEITEHEKDYIINDVYVVKEALEIMFEEGHNKLTIGACCLSEYKNICKTSLNVPDTYEKIFPNLYKLKFDKDDPRAKIYKSWGHWIRKSYKGGWCYLVEGKENKVFQNGVTFDVNSLYPSMMHSVSGNYYPIGLPTFWEGDFIPDEALLPQRYYFIQIKTRFEIKKGYLPFIQIKNSYKYQGTECLKTSDIAVENPDTGEIEYYSHIPDGNGGYLDTRVELTLTMMDYALVKEHYNLSDFEIIGGCWFYATTGLFDDYIDKYKQIKIISVDAKRELAKLFLNNLYGKLSSSEDSSFKIAYLKSDGSIGFRPVKEEKKIPGYIPCGSAITSYARNFTIRVAQKNYHGVDQPGFVYADTDSVHCDLTYSQVEGIVIDDKEFCCWKAEAGWDTAIFTRQKTYIEYITQKNMKEIETPYYNIKCAGMPDRCKDLFIRSLEGVEDIFGYVDPKTGELKEWSEEEIKFLFEKDTKKPIKRTLLNFKQGLKVPGKLLPKRVRGGTVLKDTFYEMR